MENNPDLDPVASCSEQPESSHPHSKNPGVFISKSRLEMLEELKDVPISEMNSKDKSIDFRADPCFLQANVRYLRAEFQNCIILHRPQIRNKIVLNIGCETGLLAMMAIRDGKAARVIAYDNSNITQLTQQVIKDNGMGDKITVIRGDLKTMELPHGISEVDVIICNWIQNCSIYYQSIIPWVLTARDRWLKKNDGLILPNRAALYLNVGEHWDEIQRGKDATQLSLDWWKHILPYNYNMSSVMADVIKEPRSRRHNTAHILSEPILIHTLDLYTADPNNLGYEAEFSFRVKRNSYWRSFHTYSVFQFPKFGEATNEPTDKGNTVQSLFALPEPETLVQGEEIYGTFKMEHPGIEDGICMKLEYKITWSVDGEYIMKFKQSQIYVRE